MKLHSFEHVPFESLANIEIWAREKGFEISRTRFYANDPLPDLQAIDWLVVMGGPMNIYEEDKFPWLRDEKKLIEKAISAGKIVIGICLGAQLIADVLGGRVTKNKFKEIGWFPVRLTAEGKQSEILGALPGTFTAFHWHGDTFQIPENAVRIAESDGCANQAFEYDNGRVTCLQFHLESTQESIHRLAQNCKEDLVPGKYVQREADLLAPSENCEETESLLHCLLDTILDSCHSRKLLSGIRVRRSPLSWG